MVVSREEYHDRLINSEVIQIEGAQGYSLGINSGFYPYTTSRECTIQQLLVDCAIPMRFLNESQLNVYGAARTFPIRVADRHDAEGRQIGTSGPGYPDQEELSWDQVGVPPELTTVTKLPRRVFSFSMQQIKEACFVNDVDVIFLNFINYLERQDEIDSLVREIEFETGTKVGLLGYGPMETQIVERHPDRMQRLYSERY
jgi:adenylosuccinate synthase